MPLRDDHKQLQVLSLARPVRVAYMVDADEAAHAVLDAVFRRSHQMWGGRFSLIVPCRDRRPIPEFMPWLRSYDPDLIYSYVDLPEEEVIELHLSIYPAFLTKHDPGRADRPDFEPALMLNPLPVSTMLPTVARPRVFEDGRGVTLVGAAGTAAEDRFVTDSFGLVPVGLRNALNGPLAELGASLIVVPEAVGDPRIRTHRAPETTVANVPELLSAMAQGGRITGMAQLSSLGAPRRDMRHLGWNASFNVVVGDTVLDRIMFWNARHLSSPYLDGSDVDLCVPTNRFEDASFVAALRTFISSRNHVRGDGGNGSPVATLRSLSVDEGRLSEFARRLRGGGGWTLYEHRRIADIAECRPEQRALDEAVFLAAHHGLPTLPTWKESFIAGPDLRLSAPEPDHLRHASVDLRSARSGLWAVDFDIERSEDHSPYSNLRHRWRLPRRLRVTGAFRRGYQLEEGNGPILMPRVSGPGLLTVFCGGDAPAPVIHVPSDHDAVVSGLQMGRDWRGFERFDRSMPAQVCRAAERSGAGREFWGVYQMFGGLNEARAVLMHRFWREQFDRYGATDRRPDARREVVSARLGGRVGARQIDLTDPEQLDWLSNIVLKEADAERLSVPALTWSDFKQAHDLLIDEHLADRRGGARDDLERDRHMFEQSLRHSVEMLCDRGVLHQGYEAKCRRCVHRSWVSIDSLRQVIECEVCGDRQPAPVDRPWQFRLNGFLKGAMRHGIAPLFWVLSLHQSRNRKSFWFDGPLDIFETAEDGAGVRRMTDVDLTMIDEGLVRMCEVKQSERGFENPEALGRAMMRLHPDVAMVAVMEAPSPRLTAKFERFEAVLAGSGIRAELLTLDAERDIESGPLF